MANITDRERGLINALEITRDALKQIRAYLETTYPAFAGHPALTALASAQNIATRTLARTERQAANNQIPELSITMVFDNPQAMRDHVLKMEAANALLDFYQRVVEAHNGAGCDCETFEAVEQWLAAHRS